MPALISRIFLIFAIAAGIATSAPRRIISTAPSITETLFALGLGDKVVGVTTYCRYPPQAQRITKIGTWMEPNAEVIVSLKPDLLILQKTAISARGPFDKLGLNLVEVKFDGIHDIYESITRIGAAAGVPDRAKALNDSIRQQLTAIHSRVAGTRPATVLFLVGRTPGTLEALIGAGRGTYLNEAIEQAGGQNILSSAMMSYAKISTEEVIARNPQVIIDASHGSDAPTMSDNERREQIALWNRYPTVSAVKNKRIYPEASDIFLVPGPRVVDLVQQLAKLLHPELFR